MLMLAMMKTNNDNIQKAKPNLDFLQVANVVAKVINGNQ
jgi:hypothetical protein